MPRASVCLPDEQNPLTLNDPGELDESKPELWPLLLPSQLSQDDRTSCYKGVVETEQTLRLAQMHDNLVDLRRLRRTLWNLRNHFKSNLVGGGQKSQTRSRAVESSVTTRTKRAVRRYRLAYTALLSLDPAGDWTKEYLELTEKDNRGPGKELHEQGVGDGRYEGSWIWRGSVGSDAPDEAEVHESIRHEWMTCRARADRWREESDLLQEEMRRVVVFLEWKSSSWGEKAGSRLGSVTADIQHGIDAYARKQASTYHWLAVSLANQWLPHLLKWGLDIGWARVYPWAAGILDPSGVHNNPPPGDPAAEQIALPITKQDDGLEPVGPNDDSGDDDGGIHPGADVCGIHEEGENSDGLAMGFEYDDEYMA
jgi:hypothetical protein